MARAAYKVHEHLKYNKNKIKFEVAVNDLSKNAYNNKTLKVQGRRKTNWVTTSPTAEIKGEVGRDLRRSTFG